MSHSSVVSDPWAGQRYVPLADIAQTAGLPRHHMRKVENAGLIEYADKRTFGGGYTVAHEDALFLLRCALIAVAAGVALVTVVRVLRATESAAA